MKLKALMVFSSLGLLGYGLGMLFATEMLMSLFDMGVSLNAGRVLGATYLGFAVLDWQARNAASGELRNAIVQANFVANAASVPVILLSITGGLINAMGWGGLGFHAVLALGFAYFLFNPHAE